MERITTSEPLQLLPSSQPAQPIQSNQPSREQTQRADLKRMKRFATSLFLAMTALFVASLLLEKQYGWLSFVKAFAEAAMVGALADWFAVTALFKHPLGLPIPHTAIIKNQKDRIGESLGNFVERNFLTSAIIASKLQTIDIPQKAAEWLVEPENSEHLAERITTFIPDVLNAMNNDDVQHFIEHNLTERLRAVDIAPITGNLLATLTANNRHQGLLDEALKLAGRLLETNKDIIREKIREESPWYVPGFVDEKLYAKIIAKADETLRDMNKNPDHELRRKFHQATQEFIQNLRTSPEYREKAEALKEEFLQHPTVQQYFSSLWTDVKFRLLADIEKPDSSVRVQIQNGIAKFGEGLLNDEKMRTRMNEWMNNAIISIVESRKNELASLIADTVKRWDGDTMSDRIELQVGRDLQFIRINGTLVGGLVGLVIYCLSLFLR